MSKNKALFSALLTVAINAVALHRSAGATITFSAGMGAVLDGSGSPIATTALFQLIDLGADGVFDPIFSGAWVGGDDVLLNQAFPNSDGWTTTSAFDLTDGVGNSGEFNRQFTLTLGGAIFTGQKIGMRWFPTVTAANFPTTTPGIGLEYGQFSRQSSPLYGGSVWVIPNAGSLVSFDPMLTPIYDSNNGLDPNSTGLASHNVVPEPGTTGLFAVAILQFLLTFRAPSRDRATRHAWSQDNPEDGPVDRIGRHP